MILMCCVGSIFGAGKITARPQKNANSQEEGGVRGDLGSCVVLVLVTSP